MNFHVITVFPEMIDKCVSFGVVGQALKQGLIQVSSVSPRQFTNNVHQTIDDRPFGGGDGMIMMAEPMSASLKSLQLEGKSRVVHLSPRGSPLTDGRARELAKLDALVLIASRYGGIDQRFLNAHVDEEVSIGDYVMSGGELGALVMIDVIARHLPGVLGNERSAQDESFSAGRGLEYPQFTRPREWGHVEVPAALLSGHHVQIEAWKRNLSLLVTLERRPDLIKCSEADLTDARRLLSMMSKADLDVVGIRDGEQLLRQLEMLLIEMAKQEGKKR